MLLSPVAEFLIAAFTIDKVDINGAFNGENSRESGIAALEICFAHKQRESGTGVMSDTCGVARVNRPHVGHQAFPGSIILALEFELLFGALVLLFYPEFGVMAALGVVDGFNAQNANRV